MIIGEVLEFLRIGAEFCPFQEPNSAGPGHPNHAGALLPGGKISSGPSSIFLSLKTPQKQHALFVTNRLWTNRLNSLTQQTTITSPPVKAPSSLQLCLSAER